MWWWVGLVFSFGGILVCVVWCRVGVCVLLVVLIVLVGLVMRWCCSLWGCC